MKKKYQMFTYATHALTFSLEMFLVASRAVSLMCSCTSVTSTCRPWICCGLSSRYKCRRSTTYPFSLNSLCSPENRCVTNHVHMVRKPTCMLLEQRFLGLFLTKHEHAGPRCFLSLLPRLGHLPPRFSFLTISRHSPCKKLMWSDTSRVSHSFVTFA